MSALDRKIFSEYGGDRGMGFYMYSNTLNREVDQPYLYRQYQNAMDAIGELEARIAELEEEVATLELTPPLPEWKGKRVVAVKDSNGAIYDGEAFQDIAAEVLPGWRPV